MRQGGEAGALLTGQERHAALCSRVQGCPAAGVGLWPRRLSLGVMSCALACQLSSCQDTPVGGCGLRPLEALDRRAGAACGAHDHRLRLEKPVRPAEPAAAKWLRGEVAISSAMLLRPPWHVSGSARALPLCSCCVRSHAGLHVLLRRARASIFRRIPQQQRQRWQRQWQQEPKQHAPGQQRSAELGVAA